MKLKHLRMLGLGVVAATALMAFVEVGAASATRLTSPAEVEYPAGSPFHAVNEGTVTLTTSFKNIECTGSTISGTTREFLGTPEVKAGTLTFSGCNCEVARILPENGYFIITSSGNSNGSVSANSIAITASCSTIFGTVHCIYSTSSGTALGTLTGSATTSSTATIDISSANIPRLTTSALCDEKANWDAKYIIDNPDSLFVD